MIEKSCVTCGILLALALSSAEDPGNTVGGACQQPADCLDGLSCTNRECRCPDDCTYDSNLQACNCGADEFSSLPLIMVAIVWAPINIFIWYKCFKSAREGRGNNRRTEDEEESPPKLPLHTSPNPPPITVEGAQTVANTHSAPTDASEQADLAPDAAPDSPTTPPAQRPVFVVATDETQLPIDPRNPGVFTPPGHGRVSARADAWNESPRVN